MISIEKLYEHQKKYYDKLLETGTEPTHTIVCIPTGGGKTKLAVTYAINHALESGKKVLWITHSKYLLNQAYSAFWNDMDQSWMREFAILIHSDKEYEYMSKEGNSIRVPVRKMEDLSSLHRLICVSFQSIQKCKRDWKEILGEDVVVIVDEAHHVIAESYMNTIGEYTRTKKVIGLTATPIRTKMAESNDLYRYFATDLGVRVHIATLFKNKVLVPPVFEEVEFAMDTSDIYNVDELTKGLISEVTNYNQLILKQFKDYEEKYGKTVIFAIDREHVDTLYELFCKEYGPNKVFRVYSGLADREEQFRSFQKSEDGILINVNIMNEGVDIPDIRTVFMTRPLNSRIMVTQIIGRALRKAKDKNNAYIVNFAVSNLGRKFLVVSPKLTYKLYAAEWNGNDKEIDELELEEEGKDAMARLVKEHEERKAVCTFSNICLAGHYTIIDGEDRDMPVPVSFVEYRMIENYISAKRHGVQKKFPSKLFFCEEVENVQEYIDHFIKDGDTELVFTKYDEELFGLFEKVYEYVLRLDEEIRENDLNEKGVKDRIVALYEELQSDMRQYGNLVSYLSQIGANRRNEFVRLMRNELSVIKYRK